MKTKLSKNGMITLPAKIKNDFDMKIGDEISFVKTESGYLMIPVKTVEALIRPDEMDLAILSINSLKKDHLKER